MAAKKEPKFSISLLEEAAEKVKNPDTTRGGEGKTSGGRPSVSPWGKLTKGPKTRSPRKQNALILQPRRAKK